jgi:hypothetical protein
MSGINNRRNNMFKSPEAEEAKKRMSEWKPPEEINFKIEEDRGSKDMTEYAESAKKTISRLLSGEEAAVTPPYNQIELGRKIYGQNFNAKFEHGYVNINEVTIGGKKVGSLAVSDAAKEWLVCGALLSGDVEVGVAINDRSRLGPNKYTAPIPVKTEFAPVLENQKPLPEVPQKPLPEVPQKPMPEVPQKPMPEVPEAPKRGSFWKVFVAVVTFRGIDAIKKAYNEWQNPEPEKQPEVTRQNPEPEKQPEVTRLNPEPEIQTEIKKSKPLPKAPTAPVMTEMQAEEQENIKLAEELAKSKRETEKQENIRIVEELMKNRKETEAQENVKLVEEFMKSEKETEKQENIKLVNDYIMSGKETEEQENIRLVEEFMKSEQKDKYDPSKPASKQNAPKEISANALWNDSEFKKTMEQTGNVPNDGSCFYHSVIRNGGFADLYPTVLDLRNYTANWLMDNKDNIQLQQFLFNNGTNLKDTLAVVADGWASNAGDIVPTIVSSALGAPINVHRPPSLGGIANLEALSETHGAAIDVYQCGNHYETSSEYFNAYHKLHGIQTKEEQEKASMDAIFEGMSKADQAKFMKEQQKIQDSMKPSAKGKQDEAKLPKQEKVKAPPVLAKGSEK